MTKKPREIELSPDPVTASTNIPGSGYVERSESVADRVNKWFIEPLKRMKGSEGFLVLVVLFPLYEKHLRTLPEMRAEGFSEGNPIFRVIGRHLGLSKDDAYHFWEHMRNGLLHRAAPYVNDDFDYVLRDDLDKPIEKIAGRFWINPFSLRDRLLAEIVPNVRAWKEDEVLLPKTFDFVGP